MAATQQHVDWNDMMRDSFSSEDLETAAKKLKGNDEHVANRRNRPKFVAIDEEFNGFLSINAHNTNSMLCEKYYKLENAGTGTLIANYIKLKTDIARYVKNVKTFKLNRDGTATLSTTCIPEKMPNQIKVGESIIKISELENLNQSRGFIYAPQFVGISDVELKKINPSVKNVQFMKRMVDGKLIDTGRILLTFNTSTPPAELNCGYGERFTVEKYVPNPRSCRKCNRYDHIISKCMSSMFLCRKCSNKIDTIQSTDSNGKTILKPNFATHTCTQLKCINCPEISNSHSALTMSCPTHRYLFDVMKTKVSGHSSMTFAQAKSIVDKKCGSSTYADAVNNNSAMANELKLLKEMLMKNTEEMNKLVKMNEELMKTNALLTQKLEKYEKQEKTAAPKKPISKTPATPMNTSAEKPSVSSRDPRINKKTGTKPKQTAQKMDTEDETIPRELSYEEAEALNPYRFKQALADAHKERTTPVFQDVGGELLFYTMPQFN